MDKYKQRHQQIRVMDDIKRQLALHETFESEEEDLDEYEEEDRFVNLSLLSHIGVRLRDKIPRGTHVKGGIPYHRAFTGKDIVVRIPQTRLCDTRKCSCALTVDHPSANTTRTSEQHADLSG